MLQSTVDRKEVSTINILNQLIDDEEGVYRVCVGDQVGYITISTDVFDEDTMCRPHLLIPQLPRLPEQKWSRIKITKQDNSTSPGKLAVLVTNEPLPEIRNAWHPNRVDALSLKQIVWHRSNVHEVIYNGVPAISKIAALEWDLPALEREVWAYSVLDRFTHDSNDSQIAPNVLGHLTECGRVIGLLLERQEGEYASGEDLAECTDVLQRLHRIGLIHGDVNRYNFIVNRESKRVTVVDFEHATVFQEESARIELESLRVELEEHTGRGGTREG
jgi:hypothetical protein